MLLNNVYGKSVPEWDAFYSAFTEKAEDCYIRWLNQDTELSEAETKLAREYQELIGEQGDTVEIEIPPDHDALSPDELQALLRIATKLQRQGLGQVLSMLAGVTLTDETCNADKHSCKVSNSKASEGSNFTNDTRVF